MLRQILQAYRTHSVMAAVEAEIRDMFRLAQKLYGASSQALLEQKQVEFDLYARDREINMKVVEVRKKIVEHLAVSRTRNIGGTLVFLKVINDLERVGDYSKNILDLAKMLSQPLSESRYLIRFKEVFNQVDTFFSKAQSALFDGPVEDATEVIEAHQCINQTCEQVLEELMNDAQIGAPEGIALALTARYFKRVSSHLKNVASTGVNPFSHIGYMHPSERISD